VSAKDVAIRLQDVDHYFTRPGQPPNVVLKDINLEFVRGSFNVIVGPTGCGKSTILNMLAGLISPPTGQVEFATDVRSSMAYMFQGDTLLPWRTAVDNVAIPLLLRGAKKQEARAEATQWLRRVGLGAFTDFYPAKMSGGMRKRTLLAQALIYSPHVLLMDEPFGSLDAQTRTYMQDLLLRLWQELGQVVLFVTHDLEEAVALADEVIVMSAGPASTVKSRFAIDIPRPRVVEEVRLTERFRDIYGSIWATLGAEVARSRGELDAV
jgi:NitT/TauT family transport system ATP-binding protein